MKQSGTTKRKLYNYFWKEVWMSITSCPHKDTKPIWTAIWSGEKPQTAFRCKVLIPFTAVTPTEEKASCIWQSRTDIYLWSNCFWKTEPMSIFRTVPKTHHCIMPLQTERKTS